MLRIIGLDMLDWSLHTIVWRRKISAIIFLIHLLIINRKYFYPLVEKLVVSHFCCLLKPGKYSSIR